MKKVVKYFIIYTFLISLGLFSTSAYAETTYTEFVKATNQLDKEWAISFSQEVGSNVEEINKNIRVVNKAGESFALDENKTKVENSTVTVYPKNNYVIGETYTLYVESGIKSKNGESLNPPAKLTFSVGNSTNENENKIYDQSGSYNDGIISGNVTVTAANVTLNNMVINGDLVIAESVGEGEVFFNNVTVKGETRILGGGQNSVYFENSILATVIVNKNTGAVRIVVKGDTSVEQVSLESSAILQEEIIDGASGFTNIQLQESMRNSDNRVELIGSFETINVYALDVQVTLPKNSTINDLILAAVATVKGQGIITKLEASQSASGSQLETTPHSAVLTIGTQISVGQGQDQTIIDESYTQEKTTSIQSIEATPSFIKIYLEHDLYNLTLEDFYINVLNSHGNKVELSDLTYDANTQMIFFKPLPFNEQTNDNLTVQIGPSSTTNKLIGKQVSTDLTNYLGFSGKITDIYGNAIANATILVTDQNGEQYRGATNAHGYYYVYTSRAGEFRGSIEAPGYYTGSIIGIVTNNNISTGVNETLMRAASSKEWKIIVTWNGLEKDIDSHLANEQFHVFYANREHIGEDGIQYVDLDWDDTDYYGPETTTIRQFQDGRYIFFLHNYSNMNSLDLSNSKIEVYKGNSKEADYTFTVPKNTKDKRYWGAFELYVSNNGEKIDLVPVNVLTNNEYMLVNPKNALQDYIESLTFNLNDYIIEDKQGFTIALQKAQQLLYGSSATFEQLIDAYNNLNGFVQYIISYESNYLRLQYKLGDRDTELTTSLNKPFSFILETKPYEYPDLENNSWFTFKPGENINMSIRVYNIYDETYLSNQTINIKNLTTGEFTTKKTDENGIVKLGTFTAEELINLNEYEIEPILSKPGYSHISMYLESINSDGTINEHEYFGTIKDNIDVYVNVTKD